MYEALKSDHFRGVIEPTDVQSAKVVITDLRVDAERLTSVNSALTKTSRALSIAHYLEGKYESKAEVADAEEERVYARFDKQVRPETGRPSEKQVRSLVVRKKGYKECLDHKLKCLELYRLMHALRKGVESRFRALEQVSNNERIDARDKEVQ